MKEFQIVRFKRTYGFITCIDPDYVYVKDLYGKVHKLKEKSVTPIPGLEHPVAPKKLLKDDYVALATITNDKEFGIKLTVEYLKVSSRYKMEDSSERLIGRHSITLTDIPTWRTIWKDGDVEIKGLSKLNW